jgi:hypothetical protein
MAIKSFIKGNPVYTSSPANTEQDLKKMLYKDNATNLMRNYYPILEEKTKSIFDGSALEIGSGQLATQNREINADEKDFVAETGYGVSGTDLSKETAGALPKTTATTNDIIKQAQNIADQAYGDSTAGDIDWGVASLLYFSKMAENASKPGATALGAGASAFTQPAAYIMQKDKEKQALEAKKGATVASLVPALVKANTTTAKDPKPYTLKNDVAGVGKTGETVYYTANEFKNLTPNIKKSFTPYEKPSDTVGAPISYTLKEDVLGQGKKGDTVLLTNKEFALLGDKKKSFSKYAKPEKETFKMFEVTTPFNENGIEYKIGDKKLLSNKLVIKHNEKIKEAPSAAEENKIVLDTFYKVEGAYKKDVVVKGFLELKDKWQKIQSSYEQAYEVDNPKVADLSMIFAYMKMLDPRSVVREGEQQQASGTGSLLDDAKNAYNSVLGKGKLTDKQRKSFRNLAADLFKRKGEELNLLNKNQGEPIAKKFGVDFNLYKTEYETPELGNFITLPKENELKDKTVEELNAIIQSGATNLLSNTKILKAITKELADRAK